MGARERIALVAASGLTALAVSCSGLSTDDGGGPSDSRHLAAEGWTTTGDGTPEGRSAEVARLSVTEHASGIVQRLAADIPPPTNRWYTGMVFGEEPQPVFALPLAFQAGAGEVALGLPRVTATENTIAGPFVPELTASLDAEEFEVTAADPVSVTATYHSGDEAVGQLTSAAGWPYLAYTASADQTVGLSSSLVPRGGGVFAATEMDGTTYGAVITDADGRPVALDETLEDVALDAGQTLLLFAGPTRQSAAGLAAGAVPLVDVSIAYSVGPAEVRTRLAYQTVGDRATVVAAMPHHDESGDAIAEVESVYGPLRLLPGNTLISSVPRVDPAWSLGVDDLSDRDRRRLVEQLAEDTLDLLNEPAAPQDSYFGGKAAQRTGNLLRLAVDLGRKREASRLAARVTRELDEWFAVSDCPATAVRCFSYEPQLQGVVGQQPAFGSEEFNDHHFHYGYFLNAAALVGHEDKAAAERWAPTVDALAADIASPRTTRDLPALRSFDPYAGHSWASGTSPFADGNNQESSSEAVNAWNGLGLWATLREDDALLDQAIWMLSTEAATALAYWVAPEDLSDGYTHRVVALNWGGKRDWATFFSAEPSAMLGIQLIPMGPVSTYLDGDPDRIELNVAEATAAGWKVQFGDYLLMYLALARPAEAMQVYDDLPDSSIDDGNSRSYMLAWLMTRRP